MKKLIFIIAITMLITCLPAPTVTLTFSALGDGYLQVIGSGTNFLVGRGYSWVFQSTTDFTNWTAISTNNTGSGNMSVTNIVQMTNDMRFYRVYVK
jgi:hypothetical protein